MSSNYEWQKYQANERIQARMNEAVAHRQATEGNNDKRFSINAVVLFPILLGIIIIVLSLSSCTVSAGPASKMETTVREVPGLTMAERIRFQDERDVYISNQTEVIYRRDFTELTMAERIRFHDSIIEKNQ